MISLKYFLTMIMEEEADRHLKYWQYLSATGDVLKIFVVVSEAVYMDSHCRALTM
jgi:hypothetical protein